MSTQSLHALYRWAGAASIAALGLAVFLLPAPAEHRAEQVRPSGELRQGAVTAVAAAPGMPAIAPSR